MKLRTFLSTGCALLALGAFATSAYAQNSTVDEAADGAVAEEIVVTAQGRTQALAKVPVSVTVTTGEDIQRANLRNLEDVAARLPNVRISQAPISDFVNIRGVGSSLNIGFEQSVGTFVDGVYRGRSRATRASLFDVERIEVLRGPQSTFFGNNTIAGALNITTRKPADSLEMNGTAFFAPAFNEYTVEAGVSVPVTDTLSARVSGRASGMSGYIKNVNPSNDGPNLDDMVGRVALAWQASDRIKMNARVDVVRMRDTGVMNSELVGCPVPAVLGANSAACNRFLAANGGKVDDVLDYRSGANFSRSDYDMVEGLWNTDIEFGDHHLILNTSYFHHKSDVLNDALPIPANQGGSVVGTSHSFPLNPIERFNQFSQEVRLVSPEHSTISYILGAYYAHTKMKIDFYQGLFFAPFGRFSGGQYTAATPIAGQILNRETSDTFSVFGAGTFNASDALRLNVGLRYSEVKKSAARQALIGSSGINLPNADNFVLGNATSQTNLLPVIGYDVGDFDQPSRLDRQLMPSASIQYDFAPGSMGYVSYAKGFKAGGFSVLVSKSIFKPEKVDAFEAGLKTSLFDGSVTLNLAGFYTKYKDLQESTTINLTSGSSFQVVANVAQSTSKGIELGTAWKISDNLKLKADVAYLDAVYDNYPGAPCTALQKVGVTNCVQNLAGKRRAFAPEWSGNVGASFNMPVGADLAFNVDLNTYFSSRFYQQPIADPYLEQPGYAKIDARVAIGRIDGQWEFAIVGRNLTNKLTASYRQTTAATQSFQALADPPRSIGFQLTFKH